MKYIFFISLPLYALDRVTKYFVLLSIEPDETRVVIARLFSFGEYHKHRRGFWFVQEQQHVFHCHFVLALLFASCFF